MLLILLTACLLLAGRDLLRSNLGQRLNGDPRQLGVLPGEFEKQEALLLAWPRQANPPFEENVAEQYRELELVLCDMVQAIWQNLTVIVLVPDPDSQKRARSRLSVAGVPLDAVRFVQVLFDTEWIRDYGPVAVVAEDGLRRLVDAEYVPDNLVSLSRHDDRLASELGVLLGMNSVRAPLGIQHGNLLSNGQGLLVTTRSVLVDNSARGYDQDDVTRILKKYYGAEEVVYLENLRDEHTGHVDMFASFVSPDTIVVGELTDGSDPINAAVLDRNARQLAKLAPPWGTLKVVRIPMPTRRRRNRVAGRTMPDLMPTYTNVVFANGTLLVPIYPGLDRAGEQDALDVYRRLLPEWSVVPIDATAILESYGSLHCLTLNLPPGIAKPGATVDPSSAASME